MKIMSKTNIIRFSVATVTVVIAVILSLHGLPSPAEGYNGDTAKAFRGRSTVIYKDKSYTPDSNALKDFKTDETDVMIYHAWYSWHWGDSGVGEKHISGDDARMLLYELSKLEPTGETAPAETDLGGNNIAGTYWIQTKTKKYRIPNDNGNENEIHLVADYHDEGEVLRSSPELKTLVQNLYSSFGKKDCFRGEWESGVLEVQKIYDSTSNDTLIITDIERNVDDTDAVLTLVFTASESKEYRLSHSIMYSEDNFGGGKDIVFDAKAGEPVTLTLPISSQIEYYNLTVSCGSVNYYLYLHSH